MQLLLQLSGFSSRGFLTIYQAGTSMRAVADDHQAALSVGVSLNFIWIMVWTLAGFVALVQVLFGEQNQEFNFLYHYSSKSFAGAYAWRFHIHTWGYSWRINYWGGRKII